MSETTPCFFCARPAAGLRPFRSARSLPPASRISPTCENGLATQPTFPARPVQHSLPGASRSCTPRRRHPAPLQIFIIRPPPHLDPSACPSIARPLSPIPFSLAVRTRSQAHTPIVRCPARRTPIRHSTPGTHLSDTCPPPHPDPLLPPLSPVSPDNIPNRHRLPTPPIGINH